MKIKTSVIGFLLLLATASNAENEQVKTEIGKEPTAKKNQINEAATYTSQGAFAVIGDYGEDNETQAEVANLVNNVFPTFLDYYGQDFFLVTVGDNNYTLNGEHGDWPMLYAAYNASVCESANNNGIFYKGFMPGGTCPPNDIPEPPARGEACTDYNGDDMTLLDTDIYPAPGNEDNIEAYNGYFRWARQGCAMTACTQETVDWVNEQYSWTRESFTCDLVPQNSYDVKRGDYHLFVLDTHWLRNDSCNATDQWDQVVSPEFCYDHHDYDSLNSSQKKICAQGFWMQWAASLSTQKYKIAAMHHSPFSSSNHGSCPAVQYNFRKLGIDTVFSGHTHIYERITTTNTQSDDEYYYFINGSGGTTLDKNICDSNVRIGEPHFWEENEAETLEVRSIIGYNRKLASESNPSGYGAMFVSEGSGILTPRFIDHRSTAITDAVDFCSLDVDFHEPDQSAPASSVGCASARANTDYAIQCCDPEDNSYVDCD